MKDFDHPRYVKQPPEVLLAVSKLSAAGSQKPRLAALGEWMQAWLRRREFKRLAASLLAYDDYQLDDIGFTRQDLWAAIELPLKADAGRVLASWQARHLNEGAARTRAACAGRRSSVGTAARNRLRLAPGDIAGW